MDGNPSSTTTLFTIPSDQIFDQFSNQFSNQFSLIQATADIITRIVARLAEVVWGMKGTAHHSGPNIAESELMSDLEEGPAEMKEEPPPSKKLPLVVTDATACCGGNSISFLSAFR